METTPWRCGSSSWNLEMFPKFVEFILQLCRLSWTFAGCCGAAVGQLGALEGCYSLPGISRGSPWSYRMKAHTGAVEALKLFLSYSESVINNNKKRWKFCMVPKHNLDDVFFHNIISQLNKNYIFCCKLPKIVSLKMPHKRIVYPQLFRTF